MIRRAALITLAVAVAGGLMVASASASTAAPRTARTACATAAVIKIQSFTFRPSSVRPGQSSTATLTAVNCTAKTQQTGETWFGRFTRPGTAIPSGCPVIDPIVQSARFAPHGTVSTHLRYLVPANCTATRLVVTVNIDGNGKLLATGSATLRIARCVSGYLCLIEPNGSVVLVPSHHSETFSPGLPVNQIDNKAASRYCDVLKYPNGAILLGEIPLGADQIFPVTVKVLRVTATTGACPVSA